MLSTVLPLFFIDLASLKKKIGRGLVAVRVAENSAKESDKKWKLLVKDQLLLDTSKGTAG